MIDLDKQREAFEDGYANHLVERDDSGFYINDGIQNSWEKHLLKAEIDSLKAQLAKIESGEYMIVPKEPTEKMMHSALMTVIHNNGDVKAMYKVMIEAAQENSHE